MLADMRGRKLNQIRLPYEDGDWKGKSDGPSRENSEYCLIRYTFL